MTSIAHFNILEPIGTGGVGEVLRARDTKVGRTVALKLVDPRITGDRAALERLLEDAAAAARLSHPNIAALWEFGEADGRTYLSYEFIAGRRLRDEVGGVAINPRRALDLAIQIADGVADGHAQGVIHGDLRPDTVMVTAKGSAKILDFGMAQWTRGGALRAAASKDPDSLPADAVAVLAYLSPEQAIGGAIDQRTDVFSLGVLAYELVTGKSPFAAPTAVQTTLNVIKGHATPPSAAANAPKELDPVLARALAPDISERQQSAAAFAAELRSVAAMLDVRSGDRAAPSALLPLDDTPDRRATGMLVGALAAAAAAAVAVWWWLSR